MDAGPDNVRQPHSPDAWAKTQDLDRRLSELESSDDLDELIDVGCLLADAERVGEAERCFRRASQLGSAVAAFNLGNSLRDQGRIHEAVAAYQQAVAGGETDAWLNLGLALEALEDDEGAISAFREAARAGDSTGALALAFCLRERGVMSEAMAAARQSADAGNLTGVGVLACWEWGYSRDPAQEPNLRVGAEHCPSARAALADLLRTTGRLDEARHVLERGAKLGERESWLPLGNLYVDDLGDEPAAEVAYREGITAGDSNCHHNLGVLLAIRGATDEAEDQFRQGAAAGDALAWQALRDLRESQA